MEKKTGLKAAIVPLKFREINEREAGEYEEQMERLQELYGDVAEFAEPVLVGEPIPECDAVLFPQLIGAGYHYKEAFLAYEKPMLVITSRFGTVDMWDWELISYMRSAGLNVFSPYNTELGKVIFRALAVKNHLRKSRFLMFQDDPGEGMQAYIFKRFYWWEKECTETMEKTFGIEMVYRSWKEVNARAAEIDSQQALK